MHLKILLALVAIASPGQASFQKGSNCETSCGNVSITFPFGTGPDCYHSDQFLVTCDRSLDEPIPFFGQRTGNLSISSMSTSNSEMEILMFVAHDCYNISGYKSLNRPYLTLRSFRISKKNRFVAIGCDTYAYIRGEREDETIGSGCVSVCDSNNHIINGSCSGVGCCKIEIPEGMSSFNLSVSSYNNHATILDFDPCSHAFVVNEEKFNFSTTDLIGFGSVEKMPMLLDWAIGDSACDIARLDTENFLCNGNSKCDPRYGGPGYRCTCLDGYEGNPYIKDNCKNINECEGSNHGCVHKCTDYEGSYECSCQKGYTGDGRKQGSGCENINECEGSNHGCVHICTDFEGTYECSCRKGYTGDGREQGSGCTADRSPVIKIAICTSAAVIMLLVLVTWVYMGFQKRKGMMLREKFFRQNGGIMLQQRTSKGGGSHDRMKLLFTAEELKRATNNYNESMIIGKGGYGTVYRGVLSDNRVVAIKKSKLADQNQSQIEQFINEVVILSQINHRNVVKLIGCCLETEIPLLVYEFISNGTLSDHIHNESKSLAITWDIRLKIAMGTAEALSYLHSAASVPIIHRDIKPMNILLDDNYVAKVADFGASKLIPMDQVELATIVQGTLGYLDPEYMQTNQLTDKSDVYSFGVVLAELLTGMKALSFARPETERNLASYFLSSLKEGRLFQVLDKHLKLNVIPNEIIQVSRLAERCLQVKGDERPTMKEVAIELEGILTSMIHNHPWVQSNSNEDEDVHLLKQSMVAHECIDKSIGSSRTFDSMSKLAVLPIASGR